MIDAHSSPSSRSCLSSLAAIMSVVAWTTRRDERRRCGARGRMRSPPPFTRHGDELPLRPAAAGDERAGLFVESTRVARLEARRHRVVVVLALGAVLDLCCGGRRFARHAAGARLRAVEPPAHVPAGTGGARARSRRQPPGRSRHRAQRGPGRHAQRPDGGRTRYSAETADSSRAARRGRGHDGARARRRDAVRRDVSGADAVDRFRVSFRTDDRVVPHIDRRRPERDRASANEATVLRSHRRHGRRRRRGVTPRRQSAAETDAPDSAFRFRSGVELINVTATVSDASGRFVPGLTQDDFIVYEDDQRVEVTHFSAERVPVSLGIALDTSGSMAGEKMGAARGAHRAIRRRAARSERRAVSLSLQQLSGAGAGMDARSPGSPRAAGSAGAERRRRRCTTPSPRAIPLAQQGQNRKKALVVISDGNDTSSRTDIRDLKQQIRQSEVLVYAVGIDGDGEQTARRRAVASAAADSDAVPVPAGGPRRRPIAAAAARRRRTAPGGGSWQRRIDDRVNVVGAARHDRRQRRTHRNHPRGPRSRSRDGRHRRRIEQAVLPRVSVARKEGRPVACDPRRGRRTAATACARAAGYVAN